MTLKEVPDGPDIPLHSEALDGLRESSSAVLDFRLLGEGLEGKEFFFHKMNP